MKTQFIRLYKSSLKIIPITAIFIIITYGLIILFGLLLSKSIAFASIGPIGEDWLSATELGMTGESSGIFGYQYGDEDHYYTFLIDNRNTYEFKMTNSPCNSSLILYDSDQNFLAQGSKDIYCNEDLEFEFDPGEYFLEVRSNYSTNTYNLSWDYDGSSYRKAKKWHSDNDIEAYFDSTRTNDWYYNNWNLGQTYHIYMEGESGTDFDLYIFDQTDTSNPMESAASPNTSNENTQFTTISNKTYIMVQRDSVAEGEYKLHIEPVLTCNTPGIPELEAPSYGSNTIDNTPEFDWSNTVNTTSYQIQVDNSSSFSNPEINVYPTTSNFTPVSGLSDNTYYWRVRGYNNSPYCDIHGNWSSIWEVTINTAPPNVPTLFTPDYNSTTSDDTPFFDWSSSSGAVDYQLQVDDDSSFANPEIDNFPTISEFTTSNALNNGLYYWRVSARNALGYWSDWSSISHFTIDTGPVCDNPGTPVLTSPDNGSTTTDNRPFFDWDQTSNVSLYQIQVDDGYGFNSPVVDQVTFESNYTPTSDLEVNSYYWRVRGRNTSGDCDFYGSWGSTWIVTIDTKPPGVPSLISPIDGSNINESEPNLNWNSPAGATLYHLQVDENSTFSSPIINNFPFSSNYVPDLTDNTYFWRVRASDAVGNWSDWSSVWSFTIDSSSSCSTPGIPILVEPYDGATTNDNTPEFVWESVSDSNLNHIQIDDNSNFGSPLFNTELAITQFTPTSILENATYYWRVRGHNTSGDCNVYGVWSSVWTVTIDTDTIPPDAPTLVSPGNGTTTSDNTPSFNWNSPSGAVIHQLQVDDGSTFFSPLIDYTTSNSNYTHYSGLNDDLYYWRVRARDAGGNWSDWSIAWGFLIDTGISCPTPGIPILLEPDNGSTTHDSTPYFGWDTTSYANFYQIQVDDNFDYSSLSIITEVQNSNFIPISGLENSIYYWRVRSRYTSGDCDVNGPWSNDWVVTIDTSLQPPDVPIQISPGNGNNITDRTPDFEWTSPTGATQFQLQVDLSSTFSSPIINTVTPDPHFSPVSDLDYDIYYWRVRAGDSDGNWSDWSSIWSINLMPGYVCFPPPPPRLIAPGDGTSTQLDRFVWQDIFADKYLIQIDDDSYFGSPEINIELFEKSYRPTPGLKNGTYFWRVIGKDTTSGCDVYGFWSSIWTVTINRNPPEAALLVSPENGETIINSTPLFEWNELSTAWIYQLQVDINSSFSSPVIDTLISTPYYTPSTSLIDETYFWRVRAKDSYGNWGEWSSVCIYTINTTQVCDTPGIPELVRPYKGSLSNDNNPLFEWHSTNNAIVYHIQIDVSSNFSYPTIDIETSNIIYIPAFGMGDGTIYWRVRGHNTNGGCDVFGAWSDVWTETIDTIAPEVPSLISPGDDTTTSDNKPFFDWNSPSDAVINLLQVDIYHDFSNPIDIIRMYSEFIPELELPTDLYYWRVKVRDLAGNWSNWSLIWSFSITCPELGAPELVLPLNDSKSINSKPQFEWIPMSYITSYQIEIDNNSSFSSPEIRSWPRTNSYIPWKSLKDDTYYWRVKGRASTGSCEVEGPWSNIWKVTVDTTLDPCYILTLDHTGEGAPPTANPANSQGCNSGMYIPVEKISVTAHPAQDYYVASWNGTENNASTALTNQVIMPGKNHTVVVNYKDRINYFYLPVLSK